MFSDLTCFVLPSPRPRFLDSQPLVARQIPRGPSVCLSVVNGLPPSTYPVSRVGPDFPAANDTSLTIRPNEPRRLLRNPLVCESNLQVSLLCAARGVGQRCFLSLSSPRWLSILGLPGRPF